MKKEQQKQQSEYKLERIKVPPPRSTKIKQNDIYVTRKHPPRFYYDRVKKLFNKLKFEQVIIHGMGACIKPAIDISILAKQFYSEKLEVESDTRTVSVIDCFVSEQGWELDQASKSRKVPGITIRLIKVKK